MGNPAIPSAADRAATRDLAASIIAAVTNDERHPLAPGDHGTLIDCDESELEMAMLSMAQEIAALVKENKALRESLLHACHLLEARHDNARQIWAIRETANWLGEPFSHERVQAKYEELESELDAWRKAEARRTK